MKHQRVSRRTPTEICPLRGARNENAVAGVGARNGAEHIGSRKGTEAKNRAGRPALTSALVALLGDRGVVVEALPAHGAARTFLQGGCA